MKKFLLAVLVVAGVAACNSPQEITTGSDSTTTSSPSTTPTTATPVDTGSRPRTDTVMQGDTAKRDTLR